MINSMPYEEQQQIIGQMLDFMNKFMHRRAPQHASKSMSPYLMANNFSFDMTTIMGGLVKLKKEKELQKEYESLNIRDLQLIISDKPLDVAFWKHNKIKKRNSGMSQSGQFSEKNSTS